MLDSDGIQQLGNAACRYKLNDGILPHRAASLLPGATDEDLLDSVPHDLAGDATGPTNCWLVEAFAPPVIGISAGSVHRGLEATGQRLAELIACHEKTLTVCSSSFMEFELLIIRPVIVEPVLGPSSLPFRLQCL